MLTGVETHILEFAIWEVLKEQPYSSINQRQKAQRFDKISSTGSIRPLRQRNRMEGHRQVNCKKKKVKEQPGLSTNGELTALNQASHSVLIFYITTNVSRDLWA